jgi:hypothetical protein
MAGTDTGFVPPRLARLARRQSRRMWKSMSGHGGLTVAVLLALAPLTTSASVAETIPEARVEATIPLSSNTMAVGFDSLWTMNLATKKLASIHPSDGSVTEFPIGGATDSFARSGMAMGDGAIWVPDSNRAMLYKIDARTHQVVKEVPVDLPIRATGIGAGGGAVWAITGAKANVLKWYSAATGRDPATAPRIDSPRFVETPTPRGRSRPECGMQAVSCSAFGNLHPAGSLALRRYCAVIPPSMTSSEPVTQDDSSDARNSTPFAMSSAVPSRPMGVRSSSTWRTAGSLKRCSVSGVSAYPGCTELMRMFSFAYCSAADLVKVVIAPLAAE